MMIEADVNMGVLFGTTEIRPIMAHPPLAVSDLSLEAFIDTVDKVCVNLQLQGISSKQGKIIHWQSYGPNCV